MFITVGLLIKFWLLKFLSRQSSTDCAMCHLYYTLNICNSQFVLFALSLYMHTVMGIGQPLPIQTRSTATAERQRVSSAPLSRLAQWACTVHFAEQRTCCTTIQNRHTSQDNALKSQFIGHILSLTAKAHVHPVTHGQLRKPQLTQSTL